MRPSPALYARVRFTTKEVGRGFYRGTRTGSMGAHTDKGGYLVDWRKVRHYVVPDLSNFLLTPFVSKEVEEPPSHAWSKGKNIPARQVDGMAFLREWHYKNAEEYDQIIDFQDSQAETDMSTEDLQKLVNLRAGTEEGEAEGVVEEAVAETSAADTAAQKPADKDRSVKVD